MEATEKRQLYRDIESGETIDGLQLFREYCDAVKAGCIDSIEQTFDWYVHNCLTCNDGTLERL